MGKNLIIVESPAKAKTISKFLNNKFIVKASAGHIRDLPKKTIGVDIENGFKAKYVTDRSKSKIIKELREKAKDADAIYLASDHDREGEAIAWHILHVLKAEAKGKDVYRIVFNEITKKAIQKAMDTPGDIDMNKVDAQQARRILDRLVGYSISPVLWKVITSSLSAGRVQSVALRLICEKEEAIKAFVPVEFWSVEAVFSKDTLKPFKASLATWKGKAISKNVGSEKDALEIFDAIKEQQFNLDNIEKKQRKIHPGPAYITSTLQQDASRVLNFPPKKTMMLAQQLYEGIQVNSEHVGLISYMRTDSVRISNEAIASCRDLIQNTLGSSNLSSKPRIFSNKSKAQDAHEAIRPTDCKRLPADVKDFLENDQYRLYNLIWQKFVATQMAPIVVDSLQLSINGGEAVFKTSGSTIASPGFLKVYPHYSVSMGEEIDAGYNEGNSLKTNEMEPLQHFTKPPARFTEASLIKELESKGIGRPSTYASILNTIIQRAYVELIAKRLAPTNLGDTVNKFLVNNFDSFFNSEFTAEMESGLDEIEYGKFNWQELIGKYYSAIKDLIDKVDVKKAKEKLIQETDIECDKCHSKMVIKWGRKGEFLACPNYPECSNIKNFTREEDGTIKIKEEPKLDENCPECGNALLIKNGRFGKFIACSNYPKCKFTKPFTTGIKCPECKDGDILEKKSKKQKVFYSCSKYPECKFSTWNKPVNMSCPECNHPYVEEVTKNGKTTKVCPNCKQEIH